MANALRVSRSLLRAFFFILIAFLMGVFSAFIRAVLSVLLALSCVGFDVVSEMQVFLGTESSVSVMRGRGAVAIFFIGNAADGVEVIFFLVWPFLTEKSSVIDSSIVSRSGTCLRIPLLIDGEWPSSPISK